MPRLCLFICLLIAGVSCRPHVPRKVTPAFYYWKQTWTGNSEELRYLRGLSAGRLYIKLFDVSPDEVTKAPVPVAVLRQAAPWPAGVEIVPVIFLMNEVWAHADTTLASRVAKLTAQLCDSIPGDRIHEIQLDCDWTQTTREAYFSFLKQIRNTSFFRNRRISVTIRMYQMKYASRAGIPPANRGLLMCYNMGDLRKSGDHNSILDLVTLRSYIEEQRVAGYPLPLDIALPLFGWSVLFLPDNTYAGILRYVGEEELKDTLLFSKTTVSQYVVRKDTLLNGFLLRKGSTVRRETIDPSVLEAAAQMVAAQLQTTDPAVIFYHLDSVTLKKYPLNELQKVCRFFN
ncbi:Lipoprotein [Chitinophaga sp. 180180018-2]|nr:Lipoprotein [Chitinophaga sp. 212800010-3]